LVVSIVLGAVGCYLLLGFVRWRAKKDVESVPVPPGFSLDVWEKEFIRSTGGVSVQGALECIISFAAFWIPDGWPILAGWLAFKLASRWQSAKSTADIPKGSREVTIAGPRKTTKEVTEPVDYMRARVYRNAILHRRFVVGTAVNVLSGLAGATLSKGLMC
jgi:hypothetical protein